MFVSNHSTPRAGVKAIVVVAVIAALTTGGIFVLRDQKPSAPPAPVAKASGTMTLGRDDAPITVVEYSDFQCPFCGIFSRDIQPRLIEEYVETGQVRFEWRAFPIFGRFSEEAALAAYCAHDQGEFWAFHDELYRRVGGLSQGEKNIDTLVKIARDLELDAGRFRTCVVDGEHAGRVLADFGEGRALNIAGTPAFTVNGVLMVGAQPVETWQRVFEAFSE